MGAYAPFPRSGRKNVDNEKGNIAVCALVALLLVSLCGHIYQQYRLGKAGRELESIRSELNSARSRQRDIEEVVGRGEDILSQSIDTVGDIKRIIEQIRESYEQMEGIIRSGYRSGDSGDSYIDNEEVIDE